MSGKNKKVLIALIVCTAILLLGIAWIIQQEKPEDSNSEMQISMESTVTEGSDAGGANPATDSTKTTEQQAAETVPTEKPNETKEEHSNASPSVCFPYSIPGSSLVIEQINAYDGLFFEDGSDDEVANVTAMVLTNTGDVCAEYIKINIERNGVPLKFIASALEPGGRMIIMEADRKQFSDGTYSKCVTDIAVLTEFTMSEDQVRVEEKPEGGLYVTNITEKDIPCIRVFYKFYMADSDIYVGGITYTAKITDLAAGNSCTITPSHYFQGYSKVIMVKTYDTDE